MCSLIVTPEARKAFATQIGLTKCQSVPQRGEHSAMCDGGIQSIYEVNKID